MQYNLINTAKLNELNRVNSAVMPWEIYDSSVDSTNMMAQTKVTWPTLGKVRSVTGVSNILEGVVENVCDVMKSVTNTLR